MAFYSSAGIILILTAILTVLVTTGCEEKETLQVRREKNIAEDMKLHATRHVVFHSPLGLDEALAFAFEYNLDTLLLERQQEIKKEMATQSWLKLLPSMKADWERSVRSQYSASRSVNLETGNEALSSSYSAERAGSNHNISLMWNVLDFGLSYLAARQASDRIGISEQQIARARQDLVMKVRKAYWNGVVFSTAAEESRELIVLLEERDRKLIQRINEKMVPKRDGLTMRKDILSLLIPLKSFSHEAERAHAELARLMGLAPSVSFALVKPAFPLLETFETFDVEALGQEALNQRPELFQEDLEEKISQDNVRMSLLRMFPSPSFNLRHDWDDNPYMKANYWYTTSSTVGWDLLSIPQHLAGRKAATLQTEYIQQRRMSMAIGILSQIQLSIIQYHDAAARCLASAKLSKVQEELLTVARKMEKQGTSNQSNMVTVEIESFLARVKYLQDYSALQQAISQIENSVGKTVVPALREKPYTIIDPATVVKVEEKTYPLDQIYGVDGTFLKSSPAVVRERRVEEKSRAIQ